MEQHNAFTITEREIEIRDEDALVALVNELIWNRASRIGLSLDRVHTTLRITQPDGGIDALTDLRGGEEDALLGQGLMAWQFKKKWPTAASKGRTSPLEKELQKPGVQEVFAEGGGYVLVLGTGVPARGKNGVDAKLKALMDRAREAGCTGPILLLAAGQIAAWASSDPAALFSLRPMIRNFTRVDGELEERRHAIAFEPDAERSSLIESVSAALFGPDPSTTHFRIHGLAGVGKTRLALEIARQVGLASQTLYSGGMPSPDLFSWVRVSEQVELNLIVDECDEEQARWLEDRALYCRGRLRMISVGPGKTTAENVHVLDPLDMEAMERVVASAATLPREQTRWVAEKTRGYVKLAVLVAQAIAQGTRSIHELRNDSAVASLVRSMVAPTAEGRRALEGVALLTQVGFRDDVADEARAIATFMGLEWAAMREALRPAQEQGIVVTRGRYWYVSPELLAVWLAAEVWQSRGDQIEDLAKALPGLPSRMALFDRLAGLRDIPEIERVVAGLLGPHGPFDSLGAFASPYSVKLFSTLASSQPVAALRSLQRLLGSASPQELVQSRAARTDLVWILQRLAESRNTFFDAARLLRRLAEAEQDTNADNATTVWSKLFLIQLGSTEVPALDRLRLIDEAIADDSPVARRLAVSGLAAALQGEDWAVQRGAGIEVPPLFWRPQAWADVQPAKRAALKQLATLVHDRSAEVAAVARTTLRERLRALVETGLTDDASALLESLALEDDDERKLFWEQIQWLLRPGKRLLTDEQQARLARLASGIFGESLADRVKRFLGSGSWANYPDDDSDERAPEVIERGLAAEALASEDEFVSLLPWLFSGNAYLLWDFGERLGELDPNLIWLERLRTLAVASPGPRLLSAYLIGRARDAGADGPEWRERLLDAWAGDRRHAFVVFDATVRGTPSERAGGRVLDLIDRGWLDTKLLGWLRQDRWVHVLSSAMLEHILTRLIEEGSTSSITAGLGLLARLTDRGARPIPDDLTNCAWRLLEHPAGWILNAETSFFWETVARSLVEAEPIQVAEVVLAIYRDGNPAVDDPRLQLLVLAAAQRPVEVWAAIGRALTRPVPSLRLLWDLQEINLVLKLPSLVIEAWVQEGGSPRSKIVATAIGLSEVRELPAVARFLVRTFGNDTVDVLLGNLMPSAWTGNESDLLRARLQVVERWTEDTDPAVRAWADRAVQYLERRIAEVSVHEAEEALV